MRFGQLETQNVYIRYYNTFLDILQEFFTKQV